MNYKEIGLKIKESRKRQNLKQRELAELVNLSEKFVSNVEGGSRCSLTSLCNIANALEISTDYLLGDNLTINHNPDNKLDNLFSSLNEEQKKHLIEYTKLFLEYDKK